jgi:hypothetical protein
LTKTIWRPPWGQCDFDHLCFLRFSIQFFSQKTYFQDMATQPKLSSSSVPSSTSALNSSLPPPPPGPEMLQKKIGKPTSKGPTPVFGTPGSGTSAKTPVLISNEEIISVLSMMKQHMSEQQKTNVAVLREIKELKSGSKKSEEDMGTPLFPRKLSFNSEGSSGAHDGDIIPMQTG